MAGKRDDIVAAAIRVARREGVLGLTLDAVRQEAGVSKGGLVHHFPTKETLLLALMSALNDQSGTDALGRSLPEVPGGPVDQLPRPGDENLVPMLIARLIAVGQPGRQPGDPNPAELVTALIAAAARDPKLLNAVRLAWRRHADSLLEREHGLRELIAWLACDGLMLLEHIGVLRSDDPLRLKVLEELKAMAGPTPTSPTAAPLGSPAAKPAARTIVRTRRPR